MMLTIRKQHVCALLVLIAGLAFADEPAPQSVPVNRRTRIINGWTVHIDERLLKQEPQATRLALDLLKKQLAEIVRVVPKPAVAKLRKVPLYFSPQYPNQSGRAEFHPGEEWLKKNGRDPVMVKGVEFSNIPIFEQETRRMPNFALHELAHAYHNLFLDEGFGNPRVLTAFERAKDSGSYDNVERWHGQPNRNTMEKAYAITNPMEYFAETTEACFSRNDFYPFNREELQKHDPDMFALLIELWGVGAGNKQ
ncbi:MAG: hypothetical protein R3C59_07095 [Planctomycetaceae bacterium]